MRTKRFYDPLPHVRIIHAVSTTATLRNTYEFCNLGKANIMYYSITNATDHIVPLSLIDFSRRADHILRDSTLLQSYADMVGGAGMTGSFEPTTSPDSSTPITCWALAVFPEDCSMRQPSA